jgi:thiamine biosynthesis lipoprotein
MTHVEHVMGMAVSIDVRDSSVLDDRALIPDVCDWFHWVDAVFSTYQPSSVVSLVGSGRLPLGDAPPVVQWVVSSCVELAEATDGYFDAWASGRLDPSGLVKGWSVEVASALLAGRGGRCHAVNAGGDIRLRGSSVPGTGRPWRVGIAHPMVRDALCAVLEVDDGGVATSGTAERGPHVLDPHTGRAALDLASVTVIGPDVVTADVYATAALAMGLDGPDWLAGLDGYEAVVVDAGGHIWTTLVSEEGRRGVRLLPLRPEAA